MASNARHPRRWQIKHADCLQALPRLDPASVDAIITDPPYGLGFMGKDWDRPTTKHEAWAREALRVLKPGGHLLAFGGTRTFHRLTCALEDAGFEIRDCLCWLYGTGFPKSLDVSKAVEKARRAVVNDRLLPNEARFCSWIQHESGLSRRDVARLFGSDRFYTGEVQIVNGARRGAPRMSRRAMVPTFMAWRRARRSLPIKPPAWVEELVKDPPRPPIEHPGQWRSGRGEGTSGAVNEWSGWGTALKPAWEPIILARKPLEGTVAENVCKHGTGALHIDACRVAFQSRADERASKTKNRHADFRSTPRKNRVYGRDERLLGNYDAQGRWPANLALSHTEDCRQIGRARVQSSGHHPAHRGASGVGIASHKGQHGLAERSRTAELVERWECSPECAIRLLDEQTGDTDGASRFFYCAKASRSERDAGLGELQRGKTQRQNIHPTVKPIALMRWLVRLATPPGGLVLDPFTGSGSTGAAAVLEGARFLGIEREAEYIPIARSRIRHWAKSSERRS